MPNYIYALIDPRHPRDIRYVGCTQNRTARHIAHCSQIGKSAKGGWVDQIRSEGVMPSMITLEVIEDDAEADQRELYWIDQHRTPKLTNERYVPKVRNPKAPSPNGLLNEAVDKQKRELLEQALIQANYNKARAARALGVSRPTLYDMMARHGLVKPRRTFDTAPNQPEALGI